MLFRRLAVLTLLAGVCLPACAWAGEPKAVLRGPTTAAPDAEFWLKFTGSASDKPIVLELAQGPEPITPALLYSREGVPIYAIASATKAGSYIFALIAEGTDGSNQPKRAYAFWTVTVGGPSPIPPPGPPPTPTPTPVPVPPTPVPVPPAPVPPTPIPPAPPVPPAPTPTDKLRVVMVYESSSNSNAAQIRVLSSTAIRAYLSSRCMQDGGAPAWRVWDKDVDASGETQSWQAAWAKAKAEPTALPKIVVFADDKLLTAVPLPPTEDAALDFLKQYGGR